MEYRKTKDTEDILEFVKSKWKLSLQEFDVLETVLDIFQTSDKREIDKIEHLVNDETEELLNLLRGRDIISFAEDYLDMVEEDDIEECITLKEYDDDDLLNECDRRGFKVKKYDKINIVTESQLEEVTDLFLSSDLNKRQEIINSLKH